jgi:sarcosine oxidase
MARIDLPIRPRKRCVFSFECRTPIEKAPLTIDPTGVYFRPEGAGYIGGVAPPEDNDPDTFDLEPDYSLFEETVWPVLAERIPAFESIKMNRAWAGTYDYNTIDQNAILGPHPEVRNFFFASGFSGHGLQQSPAAGRANAEMITYGAYRSIDLSRFGYDRFARGKPIIELNVV